MRSIAPSCFRILQHRSTELGTALPFAHTLYSTNFATVGTFCARYYTEVNSPITHRVTPPSLGVSHAHVVFAFSSSSKMWGTNIVRAVCFSVCVFSELSVK